jgi:hypothetical protein
MKGFAGGSREEQIKWSEARKRKIDKQKGKWMRVREKVITAEKGRKEEQYVVDKEIKRKI